MLTHLGSRYLMMIVLLSTTPSLLHAGIWDNHVKPTLYNGFDTKGLLLISSGVAGVMVTQPSLDDQMHESWGENQKISKETSKIGDYLGMGIAGIGIATTQLFLDNENGWAHSEALVWSFIATSILKVANQRERPNGLNRHSMPSGHTSTVFATASSLAYAYGWKVALPAYMLASFVALTRVSDDAHWLSDTIAGATIGVFWGRATSFHHSTDSTYAFVPWFIDDSVGAKWVKTF